MGFINMGKLVRVMNVGVGVGGIFFHFFSIFIYLLFIIYLGFVSVSFCKPLTLNPSKPKILTINL